MAEENKEQGAKQPKAEAVPKPEAPTPALNKTGGKMAAILIRSVVCAPETIITALNRIKLYKKNACVVLDNTPVNKRMLQKVKDYITYGEISPETIKALQDKRGKKDANGKIGNSFGLNPPRGGFERKGIKRSFNVGGALGYRRDKINQLIEKML